MTSKNKAKSYAITLNEEEPWLNALTRNYLISEYLSKGYREGKTLVGRGYIFDDKALPKEGLEIISLCKRHEEVFEKIDLKKDPLSFISKLYKVEDREVVAYLKKYASRKPLSTLRSYLLCYKKDNNFEKLKQNLKAKVFEDKYYYKDKIMIIVKFISVRSPTHLLDFIKMYKSYSEMGGSFEGFTYLMYNILDKEFPSYVAEDLRMYDSKEYRTRKLFIMIALTRVESIEDLIKSTLKQN